MKTKTIFNRLALAMLMPAMLLTTACSSSDDIINNENTTKKGYTIPVTVNVTRQGDDATTRATYSGNKLYFSEGDKLFVSGYDWGNSLDYAGTLDYVPASGKFSGTITISKAYSGTADELLTSTDITKVVLLPNGYGDYDFFSIAENHGYDDELNHYYTYAFATSTNEKTAKVLAVEQFSYESTLEYSSGFALSPCNAILNFTITGLTSGTEVTATLTDASSYNTTGNVTTDGSGNATFAIAVPGGTDFEDYSLTVDDKAITLASGSKELVPGHIYNITRSAAPRALSEATTDDIGKIAGADGNIYDTKAAATTAGTTAVAMISYVDASHGLAIALENVGTGMSWDNSGSNNGGKTAAELCSAWNTSKAVTGGIWRLPSVVDWQNMLVGCGATGPVNEDPSTSFYMSYSGMETKLTAVGGDALTSFWTSTPAGSWAWYVNFPGGEEALALIRTGSQSGSNGVRACLAFGTATAGPKVAADATTEDIGKVIGADGNIYANAADATAASTTAVAMITYVGSATGETSYTHGLALALSDANSGNYCCWKTDNTDAGHTKQTDSSNFTSESGLQYNDATHNTETYPAFKAAIANNGTAAPTGCSDWFLPTAYQWNQMINACKNVLGTKNSYEDLRDGFYGVGGTNLANGTVWSSTERSDYKAWDCYFAEGRWDDDDKTYSNGSVRSAIAF